MEHRPQNPDYAADVRASFAAQGMMATLMAQIVALSPGHCTLEAPIRPETGQQHGYAHAGLGWSVGDSAAGYAALSILPKGWEVLTVEMKINLMSPARGSSITAEGRVIRAGRSLLVVGSEVYARNGPARTHVATMLGTMMAIQPRG
jgi:uncharacterized protein (TIGR00369 family)